MFPCTHCGQPHDSIPAFHADRPDSYWDVPEEKLVTDVYLTSDSCVIADRFFFVRGCLDVPIQEHDEVFSWGVWVSLSEENFFIWQDYYEASERNHIGPFFGWLCTKLPIYPDTLHLKTKVYLRDHGIRPRIELEQTDHPLSKDQQVGISIEKALEMTHQLQQPDAD